MKYIKENIIKLMAWLIVIVICLLAVVAYWRYSDLHPSTDDAYVQAHIVNMAAQVSGPVSKIYVRNNEYVKKGQLLFEINQQPFQIAVNAAQAKLALAKQTVASEEAAITAAKARVAQAKAEYEVAEKNVPRTLTLVKQGRAAKAEGATAQGRLDAAKAELAAAQGQLQEAVKKLGQLGDANATIAAAVANLNEAKLNLKHTKIYAPANGHLVNFKVRSGAMITQQQPLFAVVESSSWWVAANFKETDLERIHPGQPVKIKVDMYPGIKFKGVVQSISSGSGAAFSLLPPENATGNWVKVTQRFPVKIIIQDPNPNYPLRVGASSTVTVDTTTMQQPS